MRLFRGHLPLVLFCLMAAQCYEGAAAAQGLTRKVLLLNSYHPGYAWSDAVQNGIVETLQAGNPNWFPHIEYLDCKRFPGGEHLEELAVLLNRKYKDLSLVIAMDNPALEFALENRARLFEHSPILFCGINHFTPAMLHGHSNVTGRAENIDVGGTMEVMLRLHPAAREVLVIHDYTITGLAIRKEAEELVPRFSPKVKFRFIDRLDVEDVLKELENLPRNSLVLDLGLITDKSGCTFGVSEITNLFARRSPVPVYGAFETALRHGIIGGKLMSAGIHGARTAAVALRLLGGEKASDIPVETESDAQFMFDYAAMARFGIPPSALPKNSVIINQPVSFYAAHRSVMHFALSSIAVLCAIIALLTVNIVQRRRAIRALRMSEYRQRAILDNVPDPAWLKDKDGRLLAVNEAWCRVFRLDSRQAIGKDNADLFPVEVAKKLSEEDEEVIRSGIQRRHEESLVDENGVTIWFDTIKTPITDKPGNVVGTAGITRDITERKRAEDAIRRSEEKYRTLFEAESDALLVVDEETLDLLEANEAALRLYGYSHEEMVALKATDVSTEPDKTRMTVRVPGKSFIPTRYHRKKDGTVFPVEIASNDFELGGRRTKISAIRDISERGKREEKLRESEERFKDLLDHAPDAIFVRFDSRFAYVNEMAVRLLGASSADQLIGQRVLDRVHPDCRPISAERMKRLDAGERPLPMIDLTYLKLDGAPVNVEVSSVRTAYMGQKAALVFLRDITARKEAEQELQRKTDLNRTLLDALPCVALLIRPGTREIVVSNEAGIRAGGVPGKTCYGTWGRREDPCPWCLAPETWRTGKPCHLEVEGLNVFWDAYWIPISNDLYLHYAFDVTEKKRTLEQIYQAQKLEAMGTLAGGIAHDFNNILSVIIGNAEMSLTEISGESPARYSLDQIVKAGYRARDLVGQILAFSRQRERERKPIRVRGIAKEVLKFMRASLPSTIEIRRTVDAERDTVLADPTQIHQVLMNLCTNAHHAMIEDGGVLELALSNVRVTSATTAEHPDLQTGSYLKLGVSDTGCGMSTEVMKRIFEPYFTTKEKGMGTGLGLAVVRGIVKDLGGAVRIQSGPGKGSLFEVFIPLAEEKAISGSRTYEPLSRGHERILFVDDEEGVVDLGKRMLQHLGYEVEVRTSSIEALAAFRAKPEKFDLVITDMTMPNMTGDRLAKELIGIRSDIPIIICTGYSERVSVEWTMELGVRAVVMKPILMREMAVAIRQALEKKAD